MQFVINETPQSSLAIRDHTSRFPVRRVFCVGRNYAEHAREMGHNPDRERPFFFSKPHDAVFDATGSIPYPSKTANLHHEVELVVAIGPQSNESKSEDFQPSIWGAAVGIDLTRRDLQAAAKQAGRPWDMAKGFDMSAPCGPLSKSFETASGHIWLSVNGEVRQSADLSDMIWSVPELVAELSKFISLKPGDLIMTGTPAGVGALERGDVVSVGIDGLTGFTCAVE